MTSSPELLESAPPSGLAGPTRFYGSGRKYVALCVLAGLAYFGAAQLGLQLTFLHESASPVWPATGVSVAAAYFLGPRSWWAFFLAAFAFNLQTSGALGSSVAIGLGNAGEAVLGGWLLRKILDGAPSLRHAAVLLRFGAVACTLPAALSATVGVASLLATGGVDVGLAGAVWLTWWMGNTVGALLVAPLILLLAWDRSVRLSWTRRLELAAALLVTGLVAGWAFTGNLPLAFVAFTPILWLALRFSQRETVVALILLNLVAVLGTVNQLGPFATGAPNRDLLILQLFAAVTTMAGLVLAGLVSERRAAVHALQRSRDRLRNNVEERTSRLAASEARFRGLVENMEDLVFTLDPEGRHTGVYGRWIDREGLKPEDFLGKTPDEALGGPSRTHREAVARAANGEFVVYDWETPRDGGSRHFQTSLSPIQDSAGRVLGIVGVGREVTRDRQAAEELRRYADALAQAQRTAKLGSWDWDMTNNQIQWTDELYRVFGVDPDSFAATYENFLALLHPDDRERVNQIVQTAAADGQPFDFFHRVLRPDGQIRWVHGRGTVQVDEKGTPVRMTGTGQDVTQAKENEERFRQLFEASPDALVLVDEGGTIKQVNRQAERLFGFARNELVGQNVDMLIPGPMAQRHRAHRERFAAHPTPRPMGSNLDLRARRRDGTEFPVEVSLSPLQSSEGLMVMSAIRDVTERQRVVKEREELARLRQMNEFKGRFINMAAHELNTPLTPLKLQVHLLKNANMSRDQRERNLAILDRNLERISVLVQNMLDVGRIQSGRIHIRRRPVSVTTLAREATEAFQALADQLRIRLHLDAPEDVWAQADAQRIGQVLFNLVGNALKFTPAGGSVTLSVRPEDNKCEVRVVDTGIGLAPEQMDQLFQPFSQVHGGVQTAGHPGTGLGLYISRQLIELQEGKLWVESGGPGKGSVFAFRLSAAAPGRVAPKDEASAESSVPDVSSEEVAWSEPESAADAAR